MNPQLAIDYIVKMAKTRKVYKVLLQALKEDKDGKTTEYILTHTMVIKQRQIYGK